MATQADKPKKPNLVDLLTESKKQQEARQEPVTSSMDRQIKRKKWPPRRIAMYAAVAIFAGFIGYELMFGIHPSTLNVQAERLTIATVTRAPFQEFIAEQGTVMPITTIYLDAIEGGRVEQVFVEEGAFVNEGDPILRLSNVNLQLNVMQREAELFEQINNLRATRLQMEQRALDLRGQLAQLDYRILDRRREYERLQRLLADELIAQQEFDRVKDEYEYLLKSRELTVQSMQQDSLFRQMQIEQLEASVARMQANLDVIKQNQENLLLRAPISGQLSLLAAEVGESKSPGQRLGQIDVLEGYKVRAAIDEHYIARIHTGLTAETDFAGHTYRLVIKKVYPEVRDGRFESDLEFVGETPQGIRRGQTLQIRLALGDLSEAVLIPRGGFYQKTGGQWIYAVDPSGAFATKRPIRLGRQNPQHFEVLDGLAPGERVITSMYDNFGDMERLVLK